MVAQRPYKPPEERPLSGRGTGPGRSDRHSLRRVRCLARAEQGRRTGGAAAQTGSDLVRYSCHWRDGSHYVTRARSGPCGTESVAQPVEQLTFNQ